MRVVFVDPTRANESNDRGVDNGWGCETWVGSLMDGGALGCDRTTLHVHLDTEPTTEV